MYKIYADGQLFCSSKIEETAVINPVIRLEGNKAGTFKFIVPPTHPKYDLIQRRKTLIDVYRDDDTEPVFEGICVDTEEDFFKQRTIECEGELTFFNDSYQRPHQYTGQTSRQLLEAYINVHNSRVEAMKRFTVGQVTARDSNDYISCFTNYNTTMEEIKEDLIDDLGGYLRTRHVEGVRYLDYLAESPRTCEQVIELGVNLLDLSQNISAEDIATVIIPLGATIEGVQQEGLDVRVDITTAPADSMHPQGADYVYSEEAVARYGWIEKVVTFDEVTEPANLLAKGKKYLQETQFENLVIEAKAVDLGLASTEIQKFKLLDNIRVVSRPHGLDRYFILSKMEINLNNPENDTITLGVSKTLTMSAKTKADNDEIKRKIEVMPTSNDVKSAIDNATALITGAEGGYVVIGKNNDGQPIEIRIQDALNNPTKIWRWNQNGFGYSNDGGTTYGTAITMNGAIVADFITAGTMSANRIKGGTLQVGGSGLATDGVIRISNNADKKIIELSRYGMTIFNENGEGKAWFGIDGITISGGTINAGTINSSNINSAVIKGVSIDASCKIQTDTFSVDAGGNIYNRGSTYADYNGSFAVLTGRSALNAGAQGSGAGLYVSGNIHADGNIGCSGTKWRIVKTKNFGYKTMNAYETATPYFGDIGEGLLDEQGKCIIYIDNIFAETVDLNTKYQVFLQKYGQGDVWVDSRENNYFVVKGTPNMRFGWELKAIQLGYDGDRMETPNTKMLDMIEQ